MQKRDELRWTLHEQDVCEANAEFFALCEEHNQTLPPTRAGLEQLPRDVELEFCRCMPARMADALGFDAFEGDPSFILEREVDHGVWKYVF